MINNRQNGRRRGRNGPQVRGGPGNGGGGDRGNRIDNRARGNAAQLHEKYRNLARDAQTQGDRVMIEYYLQFADHYFRVLSESRSRFEEQQPRRPQQDYRDELRDGGDMDDGGDGFEGEEGLEGERYDRRPQPQPQAARPPREPQPDRGNRQPYQASRDSGEREAVEARPREDRRPEPQAPVAAFDEGADIAAPELPLADGNEDGEGRRRRRRGRRVDALSDVTEAPAPRLDADRLPPALAPEPVATAPADGAPGDDGDGAPPKRRRTRRAAKDDGDSSVAA